MSGTLRRGSNFDGDSTIVLQPEDGRDELWLDPRKLFRLHDQTVEIYAEESNEPDSPKPDLTFARRGAISNGDGSLQYSGIAPEHGDQLLPVAERLGDDIFCLRSPATGERAEIVDRHGRKKG